MSSWSPLAVAALVWGFLHGRHALKTEAERERPVKATARVSTAHGVITIRMPAEEAAKNGIAVSALEVAVSRQEVRGAAIVLSMQELNTLRTNYVTAKAQFEKARNLLAVSNAEYERLSALYKEDRNASLKALEAAEGTARSDRATVNAARNSLTLVESGVRQQWGPVVAGWLIADSSRFRKLVAQEDLLIQVTPPAGVEVTAPQTVKLGFAGKEHHCAVGVPSSPSRSAHTGAGLPVCSGEYPGVDSRDESRCLLPFRSAC